MALPRQAPVRNVIPMHGHVSALLAVSVIDHEIRDRMESNPRNGDRRRGRWLPFRPSQSTTAEDRTNRN